MSGMGEPIYRQRRVDTRDTTSTGKGPYTVTAPCRENMRAVFSKAALTYPYIRDTLHKHLQRILWLDDLQKSAEI